MNSNLSTLAEARSGLWLPIWAGLCASLLGIGLARFAYTPLLPALIQAQWFSASAVVYLGAANLAGYLIGALGARPLARRLSAPQVLRLMMVLVTLSFFACSLPLSVGWFFGWRLVSGIAGGAIMVLAAGTVLPHVAPNRRGLASGAIFLGLGLGIAGSGTLVPFLLGFGLWQTWVGLGLVALLLTASSWFGWPAEQRAPISGASDCAGLRRSTGIRLLFAQYGLIAFGVVPTMLFLVDFVSRGLGAGNHAGAMIWVLYGLGAIAGPVVYGFLADHLGARRGIRIVLLVQIIALGALLQVSDLRLLGLLAVVIGSFPPGVVPLGLARVHQLVSDHPQQNAAWSRATVSFAACQALAGYGYSALFSASAGHYGVLFAVALGALGLALLLDLVVRVEG